MWTVIVTGAGRAFCTGADVNKSSTSHDDDWSRGIDTQALSGNGLGQQLSTAADPPVQDFDIADVSARARAEDRGCGG